MDLSRTAPGAVPAVEVPLIAWLTAIIGASLLYLLLQENGLLLEHGSVVVHEFFHDGRHAFGAPCH